MRVTQNQMEAAIADWKVSGLNKKEFCRQRNIKASTFHYWLKRLSTDSSAEFSEVLIQPQIDTAKCEIILAVTKNKCKSCD